MLAGKYEDFDSPERRVMARYGCRDPRGVKRAMKRHKARHIEELVAKLEHYEAKRALKERAELILGRAVGGLPHHPHKEQINRLRRQERKRRQRPERWQRPPAALLKARISATSKNKSGERVLQSYREHR
jgi:hypothetical protein